MFKNIIVALDGSSCAEHAFAVAVALAKTEGSKVAVCSVVDPKPAMWSSSNPSAEQAFADAEARAERTIDEAVVKATAAGVPAEGNLFLGDPAYEIVSYAMKTHADAIVMGTHGRSGLKRLFMGSVAEGVLRSASVPVVIVRDDARIAAATAEAAP
jgi:nucleotide-binding universal stress UspA family protein